MGWVKVEARCGEEVLLELQRLSEALEIFFAGACASAVRLCCLTSCHPRSVTLKAQLTSGDLGVALLAI